ncbi:MAG TPA: serine hydrolase domain-containing protein [Candidatus Acidoferrum sp.]|nr:serine hydrolase domain-containing protein [Candidatus Acidoferrum sp.]
MTPRQTLQGIPINHAVRFAAIILACVAILIAPSLSRGQKTTANASPANAQGAAATNNPQELTAADVEVFFDGLIPAFLEHNNVAGGVVIIVKDGKVLFGKGYGYADVKTKKPISVDETMFRPGSVSKLFTCTAVMQLVEQGKLDLDADVNRYIDFEIPPAFGQPVTLRRIMTHTAGFEEWGKDLFVPSAADLEPLQEDLPTHLPTRIFPPGTMPAYSNYAMTLAGYIVQRVSGEKFEDYIANHIYAPLGMTHATFAQPLPANLQPFMSSGYALGSGTAMPYEFVNGPPAGSMAVSAGDIAHFMIAHLQDGKYGDTQILKPETARLMHTRAFGPAPDLNGMALAFFQENANGHTIIGHGGDTRWFHSHLHLFLDENVGLFISVNSAGRGDVDVRSVLFRKFIDRYFPSMPPVPPAVASAKEDAEAVSGNYITSRRGETTFEKLGAMMSELQFVAQPDGIIMAVGSKGANGEPRRWREIGPLVYRDEGSESKLAFIKNADGRFDIFTSGAATGYQQVLFTESTIFVTWLRNFALIALGLTVLAWPIGAILRSHYERKLESSKGARFWRGLVRVVSVYLLGVAWAWNGYLNALGPGHTNRSLDWWLNLLHIAGWIGVVGIAGVILNAGMSSKIQGRWIWTRIGDALTALGCIALFWFAWMCNFLSWGTKF